MISDFIKGKKQFDYPDNIRRGIQLHRFIDNFTDAHDGVKEAKSIFRKDYRLYSGAMVDVVFDHFLANDSTEFTEDNPLLAFSNQVYNSLEQYSEWLPERFSKLFPHMKLHNWLYNYRTAAGTGKSMAGVVHRAVYLTESETAYRLFEENYQHLNDCYRYFWPFVKSFARHRFDDLINESPGIL
jgi:acyl carrier protein phosphodiesterase